MYENVWRFFSYILPWQPKKITKKASERYQSLSKEEKNMNNTKISQKLKNKSRKSIEEKKV